QHLESAIQIIESARAHAGWSSIPVHLYGVAACVLRILSRCPHADSSRRRFSKTRRVGIGSFRAFTDAKSGGNADRSQNQHSRRCRFTTAEQRKLASTPDQRERTQFDLDRRRLAKGSVGFGY